MIPVPVKYIKKNKVIQIPGSTNYKENQALGSEAYKITINANGAFVEYSDHRGKIWADQTLKSITKNGKISECEIYDYPQYHHRGLNFDVSRHFFSVEEYLLLKNCLKKLSPSLSSFSLFSSSRPFCMILATNP